MIKAAITDPNKKILNIILVNNLSDYQDCLFLSNKSMLQIGDVYSEDLAVFGDLPTDQFSNVKQLSNITCFGEGVKKVGKIWWIPTNQVYTLTANADLPDSQMMVMIEKVVRDDSGKYQTVSDTRVIANIVEGVITIKGQFKQSGNYRIKTERLNMGLKEINAPFTLSFELIEFDAYEPDPV